MPHLNQAQGARTVRISGCITPGALRAKQVRPLDPFLPQYQLQINILAHRADFTHGTKGARIFGLKALLDPHPFYHTLRIKFQQM
jgi:hypothetical protein